MSKVDSSILRSIRAISFDLDGTLWDFGPMMPKSLALALREFIEHDPRPAFMLELERVVAVRNRVAKESKFSVVDLEQVRLEGIKQASQGVGRPNDDLAQHINKIYLTHCYVNIVPYQHVLPALTALDKSYWIGALTNGNGHPERAGMGHVVDLPVLLTE